MEAVTVNVRLDPEGLLADIDRYAGQETRSRSAMIRVLLVEAVVERRNHETREQGRLDRASVLDSPAVNADPTARADAAAIRSAAARTDTHPFMAGGPNGRCARPGCGAGKLAGVHSG